mmetsp:Transcript_35792/g.89993  ORF Transcript_35792/g.89993 Transcript_35792/m.89993 type:complete len:208 (-) Transcript_35792:1163-1786(-)
MQLAELGLRSGQHLRVDGGLSGSCQGYHQRALELIAVARNLHDLRQLAHSDEASQGEVGLPEPRRLGPLLTSRVERRLEENLVLSFDGCVQILQGTEASEQVLGLLHRTALQIHIGRPCECKLQLFFALVADSRVQLPLNTKVNEEIFGFLNSAVLNAHLSRLRQCGLQGLLILLADGISELACDLQPHVPRFPDAGHVASSGADAR